MNEDITGGTSLTTYTRNVAIDLVVKGTNKKIFEGKATSTGSCGVMGQVIGAIVEGIFEKFPSGSGETRVVLGGQC